MYPLEGKSWFWPLVNTRLPPGFTQSVHLMGSRVRGARARRRARGGPRPGAAHRGRGALTEAETPRRLN